MFQVSNGAFVKDLMTIYGLCSTPVIEEVGATGRWLVGAPTSKFIRLIRADGQVTDQIQLSRGTGGKAKQPLTTTEMALVPGAGLVVSEGLEGCLHVFSNVW